MLGGLPARREAESIRGALGIQSIPLIGKLLSPRTKQNDSQEILISITPSIVRAPKVTEDDLGTLTVGSTDGVRVQQARQPLFGLGEEPTPGPSPSPVGAPGNPPALVPLPAPSPGTLATPRPAVT